MLKMFYAHFGKFGIATAGSGDVLTGILLAFLAQGYLETDVACLGAYAHGKSGDLVLEKQCVDSLIASDIMDHLGEVFKSLNYSNE